METVAICISVVALVAAFLTAYYTKQQVEEMRKEGHFDKPYNAYATKLEQISKDLKTIAKIIQEKNND